MHEDVVQSFASPSKLPTLSHFPHFACLIFGFIFLLNGAAGSAVRGAVRMRTYCSISVSSSINEEQLPVEKV
jgi:hypothetical protein